MRRLCRSTRQYIIVVLLSLVLVGAAFIAAYFVILRNIRKDYGVQIDVLNNEIKANQRDVFEAIRDIEAGTILTQEMVSRKRVCTGQLQDTFVTSDDLGKTTLIALPKGTYVQKSMITEENLSDELRETMYECIHISDYVKQNDTIDVRIFYPNGENYIVLSKQLLRELNEDHSQCCLWLSEEEILLISSAIVDAYLYKNAYLYVTRYIEPSIQKASIVNYEPSLATLELIQNNPNIVEIATQNLSQNLRKKLENRLASSINTKVEDISWAVTNQQSLNDHQEERSETRKQEGESEEKDKENFTYYSEEKKAKERDVEYGE